MLNLQEFNEIRDTLKRANIKVTHARVIIYQILKQAAQEITAYDIENESLKNDDRINLGTIYSTLKLFQGAGLIQRYKVDMEQAMYSLITFDSSARVSCNHCGRVYILKDKEVQERIKFFCHEMAKEYTSYSFVINVDNCDSCKEIEFKH